MSRIAGLFMLSGRELAALVLIFLVSLPAVTPRLYSSDEVQYFSYLRSLWFDHDVSFENEYRYFHEHNIAHSQSFHETFLERTTEAGRRINFGTIGCAILWAPFYAAGDLVARALNALGRGVPVDGFSKPYLAAVAYGSAFYGFVAILLSIGAARRITGLKGALWEGIAVWLGTPLLFYMYVAPPFSHACSAFAVALFVTVWLHVRRTWSPPGAAILGLAGALMGMVREQDVFFVFGPAVDFLWTVTPMTRLTAAVAGCAGFAVGFLPQLVAYQALNGWFGPSQLVTRKMTWYAPHALQVLGSPSHGFFFWTPLAALAIAGLIVLAMRAPGANERKRPFDDAQGRPEPVEGRVSHARRLRAARYGAQGGAGIPGAPASARVGGVGGAKPPERETDTRRVAVCALLMVALQVYVAGSVESWTVAGAFGQRRFVALTILLVIGLAALRASVAGATRAVIAVASAVSIWWNVALMAQFGTGMMDRQRLELGRNAYNAFVTLPRVAPELAWRYVVHRESFYKPAAR